MSETVVEEQERKPTVGLTPYMRCTACHRAMTLAGIDRRRGCYCGHMEFVNVHVVSPMERFTCWLLKR